MRKFLLAMLITWLVIKPSSAQVFDFTLNDCSGVSHHLYDDLAAGNAVVMKFCAGWCLNCPISNPQFELIWKEFRNSSCKVKMYNMVFENSSYEESDCEFGLEYADQYHMTMPLFTGFGTMSSGLMAQFSEHYKIEAVPTTVIIFPNQQNPANSIVKIIEGAYREDPETNEITTLSSSIRDTLALGGFYSSKFNVIGSICSDPPYSLTLSSVSATGNVWSTGATTQSITINAPGEYSVTTGNACTYAETIKFIPLPVMGTASISNPVSCRDGEVTLNYNLPGGSPDSLIWVARRLGETEWRDYYPSGVNYYYPANKGPIHLATRNLYPAGAVVEFAVRGSNGNGLCTGYSNIVTLTITDEQPAVLSGTVTGPANPVCLGSNFSLNYTGGVQGAYWVYLDDENHWQNVGSADQPINPNGLITLNRSQSGSDQFRVRYLDGDCFSYSSIITVNYLLPSLKITGPLLACKGANVVLGLNGNYSNILWSTSATTPSISVNLAATTTYSVRATEQNGCSSTVQHTVKTQEEVSLVIQSSALETVCASGPVTLSFTVTRIADKCLDAPWGRFPEEFTPSSCNGNLETITAYGYLGEYSLVNVQAGKYYKFYSSGAKEIVNLITSVDFSKIYAGGIFSAVWKATFTGKVLFLTHGSNCYSTDPDASDVDEIVRSVACSADPSAFGSFLWSNGQTTSSITVSPSATTNYTLTFVQPVFPCALSATKKVTVGMGNVVLSTTNVTCNSATFNWSTASNPTQWELEYKSTDNGSKWINVPVANSSTRSVTVPKLKPNQNYQWHLRAKCNKSTTAYSDLILFKTLASCGVSSIQNNSMSNKTPEYDVKESVDGLRVVAMPNPSHTTFSITVSSNNTKERIMIQVVDIAGRIIETRNINAEQSIQLGGKYKEGIYIVRVVQDKQIKQLKLIKLPG
jgi:hypothetical protein